MRDDDGLDCQMSSKLVAQIAISQRSGQSTHTPHRVYQGCVWKLDHSKVVQGNFLRSALTHLRQTSRLEIRCRRRQEQQAARCLVKEQHEAMFFAVKRNLS